MSLAQWFEIGGPTMPDVMTAPAMPPAFNGLDPGAALPPPPPSPEAQPAARTDTARRSDPPVVEAGTGADLARAARDALADARAARRAILAVLGPPPYPPQIASVMMLAGVAELRAVMYA
ncbi:hypothetical protein ACK8OR_06485 [Jannaschia sp. KMU-145]|uniref:hypothetical protein n=1 Tax=Jannaschia halovivens TaxID=3388667 RepID=UPI00396B0024